MSRGAAPVSVIRIPLRNVSGEVVAHALVDPADASQAVHRWHLNEGYAGRSVRIGTKHTILLHRVLLGLERGDRRYGDHINRDPLDCRRSNLRILEVGQNAQNLGSNRGSTSKYRGVCWVTKSQRWVAQARVAGRNHFLGEFDDEQEAAAVASAFRAEHMPFSEDAMALDVTARNTR